MTSKQFKLPTLYHKTSKGKINIWTVWAEGDTVYTEWGQQDGKLQTASKKVVQKNIGKANETSLEEQAICEAQSMWTHKVERKYVETLEETKETIFLPMLASDFHHRNKFLTEDHFPMHGQNKFDGLRCLAYYSNNVFNLISRSGKVYNLPHISKELDGKLPDDMFLDGELYIHGVTLQEINKLVRPTKNFNKDSVRIEYHVYDCGNINNHDELTWAERNVLLHTFFNDNNFTKIKMVESKLLNNLEEVYEFERNCVAEGFEGGILRFPKGKYKFGYRSKELLKIKSFMDEEFEIVGYDNGIGKFEECVIYTCKTGEGKTFSVVPKGTFEQRKQWLAEADRAIGKLLKVKFFNWTEDNIPYQPVGICIRLEEDL